MSTGLTAEAVMDALRVCFDPELRVNIVDLGLVQTVNLRHDADAPGVDVRYRVHVQLLARTVDENREAMLVGQVQNRLLGMHEVSHAAVEVVAEPAWTSDRMSIAARQHLGLDRPPKQGLVSIQL